MVKKQSDANIAPMVIRTARIELVGDSPLIVHAWSAKAKQEILDKQMKKSEQAKEAKDPEALFQDALYRMPGKPNEYGFPAVAFKSAAVDACSHISDMTKVEARGSFHIQGSMIKLEYKELRQRFDGWGVTLDIRYNAGVISLDQLATLFNVAGFSIGVGEWRPQRDGSNGMFHVEDAIDTTEQG